MAECKICGRPTTQVVVLDLTAVSLCEACCRAITAQTVTTLIGTAPAPELVDDGVACQYMYNPGVYIGT